MDGVTLTPLKKVHHPKGDILHVMKASDNSFLDLVRLTLQL